LAAIWILTSGWQSLDGAREFPMQENYSSQKLYYAVINVAQVERETEVQFANPVKLILKEPEVSVQRKEAL
jgi:hypothetical protein